MVNASKFRFLNLPRLNPEVRLGCLLSASTRTTVMKECKMTGYSLCFGKRKEP